MKWYWPIAFTRSHSRYLTLNNTEGTRSERHWGGFFLR